MSIEKITEQIIAEASREALQVQEKAARESQAVLEKAKQQAESIRKETLFQANLDAKLLKDRKVSVAELEARKLRLAAKQNAIGKSFDLALESLANKEEAEYLKLLVSAIAKTGVTGGELMLNQRDRALVGKKAVELANATGTAGQVSLSEDTIDAKGGFVLRKGSMEINSTLETMVNAIRESATPEVVEILFQK
jgi:V/A-type H+-transporting ATPase subunit E